MPVTASLSPLWYEAPARPRPPVVVFVANTSIRLQEAPALLSEVRGFIPSGSLLVILERRTLNDGTRRAKVLGEPRSLTPGWVSLTAGDDGSDTLGCFAPCYGLLGGEYGNLFCLEDREESWAMAPPGTYQAPVNEHELTDFEAAEAVREVERAREAERAKQAALAAASAAPSAALAAKAAAPASKAPAPAAASWSAQPGKDGSSLLGPSDVPLTSGKRSNFIFVKSADGRIRRVSTETLSSPKATPKATPRATPRATPKATPRAASADPQKSKAGPAAPSSAELVQGKESVEVTANGDQEDGDGEEEAELLGEFSLPEQKSSTDSMGTVVRYASLIKKAQETAAGASGEPDSSLVGTPTPDAASPVLAGADNEDPAGITVAEVDQAALQARPSAEYFAMADAFWAEAETLLKADSFSTSLEVRLGQALHRKKMKVKELVASWAKGPSGGDINLAYFRKHVRSVVDEPDVVAIDAMFSRLDEDGGGTLDVAELTTAMKALQDAALQNEIDNEMREQRRAKLLMRAEKASFVASETAAAEAADRKLAQIHMRKPIAMRVGELLFGLRMRVDEVSVHPTFLPAFGLPTSDTAPTPQRLQLINKWEATDGQVNLDQFRRNMRRLEQTAQDQSQEVASPRSGDAVAQDNLEADDAELESLFQKFDEDGGGTLDLDELKSALNILKGDAREAGNDLLVLEAGTQSMWKRVSDLQADLQELLDAHQADKQEARGNWRKLKAANDVKTQMKARARERLDEAVKLKGRSHGAKQSTSTEAAGVSKSEAGRQRGRGAAK